MTFVESFNLGIMIAELVGVAAMEISPKNMLIPSIMLLMGLAYVLWMIFHWAKEWVYPYGKVNFWLRRRIDKILLQHPGKVVTIYFQNSDEDADLFHREISEYLVKKSRHVLHKSTILVGVKRVEFSSDHIYVFISVGRRP